MNIEDRKRVIVIQKYIVEKFSESDWTYFGQLTESTDLIVNHNRLLRAQAFGDEDYPHCVGEVVMKICDQNPSMMEIIIDYYDIDTWYGEKEPARAEKLFSKRPSGTPNFWTHGYLRVFISHLAISKNKAVALKDNLALWGMSSFVAHEDIEPTKEWMTEIELALSTMDILIAMVEPKFKESDWTDQEIGFALGRGVEIVPMRMDADPHGFMGKYQGIQAKGKFAPDLSKEILKIALKKPRLKPKMVGALILALSAAISPDKVDRIQEIDKLSLLTQEEMKEILERGNLTTHERYKLKTLVTKYKAFEDEQKKEEVEDDLPF